MLITQHGIHLTHAYQSIFIAHVIKNWNRLLLWTNFSIDWYYNCFVSFIPMQALICSRNGSVYSFELVRSSFHYVWISLGNPFCFLFATISVITHIGFTCWITSEYSCQKTYDTRYNILIQYFIFYKNCFVLQFVSYLIHNTWYVSIHNTKILKRYITPSTIFHNFEEKYTSIFHSFIFCHKNYYINF